MQILASSLSFSTVFSLVPLLAVSLSVFHAFGGFETLFNKLEPFIIQNLSVAAGAETSRIIQSSIRRIHSGTLGTVALCGLLFTSTKLFHEMDMAVNRVWAVRAQGSLIKRLIVYWLVMFLGPIVLAVSIGVLGSKDLGLLTLLPKGTLSFLFSLAGLYCIYQWVPNVRVKVRNAFWSALLAATAVTVLQLGYASLTKKILDMNKIYGSLASIPIFLMWIWILWWICLIGAAFCASFEKGSRR